MTVQPLRYILPCASVHILPVKADGRRPGNIILIFGRFMIPVSSSLRFIPVPEHPGRGKSRSQRREQLQVVSVSCHPGIVNFDEGGAVGIRPVFSRAAGEPQHVCDAR